jgi:hypothetical protein
MGLLQRNLANLIGGRQVPVAAVCPNGILSTVLANPILQASITSCFGSLGGKGDFLGPRTIDVLVNIAATPGLKALPGVDFLGIELDEAQHFNRYRDITLSSLQYSTLPFFPLSDYRTYCTVNEPLCLQKARRLGYWTNPSSAKNFGKAGHHGILAGLGSPRWKQRAFYDYLRDLLPLNCPTLRIARISIYDNVGLAGTCVPVSIALRSPVSMYGRPIINLINSRYG